MPAACSLAWDVRVAELRLTSMGGLELLAMKVPSKWASF
jgi:hypothetical protein